MKTTRVCKSLICIFITWSISAFAAPLNKTTEIDQLMATLHQRGQFNGSIIVAVRGRDIYRRAFGEANFQTHRKFTPATLACIASVSKQFTAMAIMMLAEENRINYDAHVAKYIPELSRYADGITIRHLLTHTSGIPDVGDLGIDHPRLTNDEVLHTLEKQNSLASLPGQKYRYSNTGYVLLSLIVERVARQRFGTFLKNRIFKPLGMRDTFVVDGSPHDKNSAAIAYNQFGTLDDYNSLTTGDGGIYSNVDDLLKWDRALYTERLVRQSTLAIAFTPSQVKEGVSSYGFGWNIAGQEGHRFVWHTGSTGGFRAFIERRLAERITVIMLTNKGNSKRLEINEAILNILNGKPYVLPKRSIAETLYKVIGKQGIHAAIQTYNSLRAVGDATYDFGESELNALGYQLLSGDRKTNDAIETFKLNTVAYPKSSNAFDSLGEAYQVSGNREQAIKNYQKAVELDPTNFHALNVLKKLR